MTAAASSAAVDFVAQLAARNLDVSFTVKAGETLAILGPNGAGKSTILGLLAGTLRADAGRATLGDSTLFDSTGCELPHARGISLLSQEPLLFPHLTVAQNVEFGPRSTGPRSRAGRAAARQAALRWLEAVGVPELHDRLARQLSGGQAQRVAVARAVASEPRLLLLDEPFAALDVAVAHELRQLLAAILADRTAIIVTHDVLDALLLADRVIVVAEGRIVEEGVTHEVLARPRSMFGAQLAGLTVLHGVATATGLRTGGATDQSGFDQSGSNDSGFDVLATWVPGLEPGTVAALAVRPGAITITRAVPDDARAALPIRVLFWEPRGDVVRAHCRVEGATSAAPTELIADVTSADAALIASEQNIAWASWAPESAELYRL